MKLSGIFLSIWAMVMLITTGTTHAQLVSIPIPGSPLSLTVMANPQPLQELKNNPAATLHTLGDDGWANVPLPFTFPFYGQTFTDSTMYSNGAVQFGPNRSSSNGSFCCQGLPLSVTTLGPQYNYSIMPLWTDLNGAENNNHYTLGTANSMTYGWYGVQQYGQPNNRSSFEVKIDSAGGIDMRWSGAVVTAQPVTIGTIGNAAQGEFTQNYFSTAGINIPGLTQLATGVNFCLSSPLSDPACPGYADAVRAQQCSVNALYDPTCPGYAAAFLTQQCSINTLFNESCPGYATAYLNYQCSMNPLYSVSCSGYATAYKAQQCSQDPLYATDCPGYAQAKLNAECIKDSLYSRQCEGYNTAYAIKYLSPLDSSVTSAVNSSLSNTAAIRARDVAATINTDGSVSTMPQLIGDSTVNSIVTARPDTTSATSPISVLRPGNTNPGNPIGNLQPAGGAASNNSQTAQRQEERKTEERKTEGAVAAVEKEAGAKSDTKPDNKSSGGRTENREKVREAMTARAKELASDMSRAATLEAQTANQAVVLGLISYVPGFSAYQTSQVPDSLGQAVARQYGRPAIDNRGAQRGLSVANDRLHQEMVNQQYK